MRNIEINIYLFYFDDDIKYITLADSKIDLCKILYNVIINILQKNTNMSSLHTY